ncbi:hypothetical protein A3F65_03675 [Candidatus Saccharibacteria bacterium RIFCSPHIGHO2_12_FULL_47_16b]|nr:MAG: hypothetical protein A3F65_03675 [Candidatus Saccharibacteria bacterium RIFCSPHIGHO2_12_FULL_47_16b]
MRKFQNFIFKNYSLKGKEAEFSYSLDNELYFTETYKFDFDYSDYQPEALDRALQMLFFMAGVSYYKTYLPPQIVVEKGELDAQEAKFFGKTYQKGLGEFFYSNNLDPNYIVNFPANTAQIEKVNADLTDGLLVGIGGGKDSLVSVELLRSQPRLATWSVGHRPQLEPLVNKISLPHFWVERTWDRKLLELNKQDVYNGHIPISAIFACVGVTVAILSGYQDVVVSNESSASEPNFTYKGVPINHQYSKSLEFEQDFQNYLAQLFTNGPRYYSFLRPFSELRISDFFAKIGFDKYKDVFSSCNRAFTHDSRKLFWCGECPKCAFVFLALTPFVPREKLETLWGKNLLLDPSLEPTYRQLLGIEGDKPLDCVGEIKEARTAMELAKKQYPELEKYRYELPTDYDYRALSAHSMPKPMYDLLLSKLNLNH